MPDIMRMGSNPRYLASWDLDDLPDRELVLEIDEIVDEVVFTGGAYEVCTVMHFTNTQVKPMILNMTNKKTLCKLHGTKDTEELSGKYTREKTIPMLVGSYIDAYFEGTLNVFKAQNPEIFKSDGTMKKEFLQADEIIKRMKRDRLFMQYLMGRKQVIMTGTICGVAVKIKIDSLLPDKIVDLKIMRDFEPAFVKDRGRLRWWEVWGYDLQGAVYQEIVRQNTGKVLPFYLAAGTKENTPNLDILHLSNADLELALDSFRQDVQRYDAMKMGIVTAERCGHCDFCKETKILTVPSESDDYDLFW